MKKIGLIAIIGIIAVGGYFFFHDEVAVGTDPSAGPEIDYASDVIGTRTGTTTTGTYFSDGLSTTTAIVRTGGASTAIFTVYATYASTTGSRAAFNFSGSNDWDCATASTTGGNLNPILTTDINWYDISYNVAELAGSQTISGTSTISWVPQGGYGKTITLTNLNYECIRVQANASSTIMLMQARLKK